MFASLGPWAVPVEMGLAGLLVALFAVGLPGGLRLFPTAALLLAMVVHVVAPPPESAPEGFVAALAVVSGFVTTFATLAAFRQDTLSRFLANSATTNAGLVMMAATRPLLVPLAAFALAMLGAVVCAWFLRKLTGSDHLDRYRGLVRRAPWLVVTFAVFVLSLLGVPPLVGFFGRAWVFDTLVTGMEKNGSPWWVALVVLAAANSVLAAVGHLGVLKVMILEQRAEDLEGLEPERLPEPALPVAAAVLLAFCVTGLAMGLSVLPPEVKP